MAPTDDKPGRLVGKINWRINEAQCFVANAASEAETPACPLDTGGLFWPPLAEKIDPPPRSEGVPFKGVADFPTKGAKETPVPVGVCAPIVAHLSG